MYRKRIVLLGVFLLLTACSQQKTATPAKQLEENKIPADATMSQAATNSCLQLQGKVAFTHTLKGNYLGTCQFPSGKQCTERALLHRGCQP